MHLYHGYDRGISAKCVSRNRKSNNLLYEPYGGITLLYLAVAHYC